MRWSIILACVAVFLLGSRSTADGEKSSPRKHFHVHLAVYEGDPLGSKEAGTLRCLGNPTLITIENRPFTFVSGGEIAVPVGADGVQAIPFGTMIQGKLNALKDGKVRLDLTMSKTSVETSSDELARLHSETTRTLANIRLGDLVKFRYGKVGAENQSWLELRVDVAEAPDLILDRLR